MTFSPPFPSFPTFRRSHHVLVVDGCHRAHPRRPRRMRRLQVVHRRSRRQVQRRPRRRRRPDGRRHRRPRRSRPERRQRTARRARHAGAAPASRRRKRRTHPRVLRKALPFHEGRAAAPRSAVHGRRQQGPRGVRRRGRVLALVRGLRPRLHDDPDEAAPEEGEDAQDDEADDGDDEAQRVLRVAALVRPVHRVVVVVHDAGAEAPREASRRHPRAVDVQLPDAALRRRDGDRLCVVDVVPVQRLAVLLLPLFVDAADGGAEQREGARRVEALPAPAVQLDGGCVGEGHDAHVGVRQHVDLAVVLAFGLRRAALDGGEGCRGRGSQAHHEERGAQRRRRHGRHRSDHEREL
eukprot:Rhum_TRINITY_DN6909_c0_g1::Rhum_TRINITY_DN6909_c0_g1_i1::g.21227::m.21227